LLICRLKSAIAAGSGGGAEGTVACTAVDLVLCGGLSSSDEISIISASITGGIRRDPFFLLGAFFFDTVDSALEDDKETVSVES
jgi:hypothetical protein